MIGLFRKLLPRKQVEEAPLPAPPPRRIPAGQRVFAIGDIHGHLGLFEAMIAAIEAEDARRPPARTTIILLGDLIDRGPDSAGVLARAYAWQRACALQGKALRILMGNHEEMLLESLESLDVLRHFIVYGGRETILSFGLSEQDFAKASLEELQAMLRQALSGFWYDYIAGFEPMVRIGDYAFVHAGVVPGVPLDQQNDVHLRWTREPFLSSESDHGAVIVHGHTITEWPVNRANRIGIDTGAYLTGNLTTLMLEDDKRWFGSIDSATLKVAGAPA